jgi:hypothetical protein
MTWLRRETGAHWLDPAEAGERERALKLVRRHISAGGLRESSPAQEP